MRSRMTFRRAAWSSVLTLLVAGGLSAADPQEKKGEEPAKAPASSPPAGDPDTVTAGSTDESTAPDLNTAQAAATMLRNPGKIISQTGDLKIAVDSNLFTELPGFELGHLSTAQREKLIKQSNSVFCTCGCRGDTVARCVVLDSSCQVARKMLQQMLDDIAPAAVKAKKSTSTE